MDRIDELYAIEQIRQLKARYFRFLDTKDWVGMRTVWSVDAVFDARASLTVGGAERTAPSNSDEWVYEGRDAIVAFISSVAVIPTAHHGHCHEVEIDSPVTARGVIAMEDYAWPAIGDTLKPQLHGFGHYHEEYAFVDGQWRIRRSRISRLNVMAVESAWDQANGPER